MNANHLLLGSAWAEYKKKGTICDIPLPAGLMESEEFNEAIFTPSTKAELGEHGRFVLFGLVAAGPLNPYVPKSAEIR